MSDPVAFLRDRLNEVEQIAREATHGQAGVWKWECDHLDWNGNPLPPSHDLCAKLDCDEITIYDEGGHSPEQARHIALHDPASVLRRVAADRKILELHGEPNQHGDCYRCGWDDGYDDGPPVHEDWPCETLRALAEAWGWPGDVLSAADDGHAILFDGPAAYEPTVLCGARIPMPNTGDRICFRPLEGSLRCRIHGERLPPKPRPEAGSQGGTS